MATHNSDLAGARVLITGASSGFGAHFAKTLSAQGARVALAARRVDRLQALQAEIAAAGGEAVAVALDVADQGSIIAGFDAVEAAFGGVDVLINNAGMNAEGPAVEITAEAFDQLMDVNVRGVFLCAREAAKRLIARGPEAAARGRIVNIASIGGLTVLPGLAAYCTSKAAVVMMTKALAREWARHGVCVNAICPGYAETEINADWLGSEGGQRMVKGFPRRRLLRLEDLDAIVSLLAGAGSAYITGSVFTIDDGQSL